MAKLLFAITLALGLAACAPAETDMLPEAVRAVATRAASSTPDRLLVVAGTFGDTAMTFATRQALVTAGIVVADAPHDDATTAILEFVGGTQTDEGWRLRTTRRDGGAPSALDALAAESNVEWQVECTAERCEVRDSTTW